MKERIAWIDCAKGVGMLLVIAGHMGSDGFFTSVIYSFHMPLFFMLSAMTSHDSQDLGQFRKNTVRTGRHLLKAALILWIINCTNDLIKWRETITGWEDIRYFILSRIESFLWSNGHFFFVRGHVVYSVGPIWFLIALFSAKTVFDFVQIYCKGRRLGILSCLLSALGVLIGRRFQIPFCLDIALVIQPFFFMGHALPTKELERKPFRLLVLFVLAWALLFSVQYTPDKSFGIASRNFPKYPLCLITAAFGSLMISELCVLWQSASGAVLSRAFQGLCWIGRNSLYLFCVHDLDVLLIRFWYVGPNIAVIYLLRVALDLALCWLLVSLLRMLKQRRAERQPINGG